MAEQRELLKVVQRLVTEEDFRNRLMMSPKETLITELGISRENYESLMAVLPAILAGGIIVLGDGSIPLGDDWGGWGTR